MSAVDVVALGLVALLALGGFRRGLVVGVLSLAGLVAGAVVGARLAPPLLGEDASRYAPLVALGGAGLLGVLGQSVGVLGGRWLRRTVGIGPLRALDNAGGLVLGALTGLAFVWALGAVLLYVPGQTALRRHAQESLVLSTLNRELPPARLFDVLARVDPLAVLAGPAARVDPPDPAVLDDPDVRAAQQSVVRIRGYACGLGVEGSGWVAAPGVVVTNAHVVAGIDTLVLDRLDGHRVSGRVVSFDADNDVAVVRAPGIGGRPLAVATARAGTPGAMLGFPENGPYTATAVRVGGTQLLVGRDAYGRFPTTRSVTAIRGVIRSGNSGGPIVDAQGRVMTTVFGERTGTGPEGGYGVSTELTERALAAEGPPLETACVER